MEGASGQVWQGLLSTCASRVSAGGRAVPHSPPQGRLCSGAWGLGFTAPPQGGFGVAATPRSPLLTSFVQHEAFPSGLHALVCQVGAQLGRPPRRLRRGESRDLPSCSSVTVVGLVFLFQVPRCTHHTRGSQAWGTGRPRNGSSTGHPRAH